MLRFFQGSLDTYLFDILQFLNNIIITKIKVRLIEVYVILGKYSITNRRF